jgi:L-glyceraldehyde 3-phosphate reductase
VLQKKVGYSEGRQAQIAQLYKMAKDRGQTLSQLAIEWLLQWGEVTSVLIGVHSKAQLLENLKALECKPLSKSEIMQINAIAGK